MINATPLLRKIAKRRLGRLSRQKPAKRQEYVLSAMLGNAAGTLFGKEYDFSSIKSVSEYQSRVPLRTYEDFWSEYWEKPFPIHENITWPGKIKYFPVTSGTTTGATKFIPTTKDMLRAYERAGLDLLIHHYNKNPDTQIWGGKTFVLGGSTELVEQAPGILSGDISGIMNELLPWWAKPFYFPPKKLALISNWDEKIEKMSKAALKEDIRAIGGVPSWLLLLFDHLIKTVPEANGDIKKIFPNLELIIHGGINFAPYRKEFSKLFENSNVDFREVYPASEGFIAVADRGYGDGLRLLLDHGIFFEFVPLDELNSDNPTRHWVKTAEKDVNYAVVLTSCAGVWSYILGDTVRFVDLDTPRILITGRTSYSLSCVGEHLIAEEIEECVSAVADQMNLNISDYSVGATYPASSSDLAGHVYIIEFNNGAVSDQKATDFISQVDQKLIVRNEDYEAHRRDDFGLKIPKIEIAKPGTFAAWMKSRGKLGGQNKVPRIINDDELLNNLRDFAKRY